MIWILAVVTFALDRVTKLLAVRAFTWGQTLELWRGVLELRLTRNNGMALGILSGNTVAIIVLPVVAVGVGLLIFRKYRMTGYTRIASGLILGGFAGNLIDRVALGYVVDMIYLPWMPWFICNVADIVICVGVAMLAISLICRPQDWREHENHSAS